MVRVRTPNGYWMHQPPCAKAEGPELYRRIGRELVTKTIGRLRFMTGSDRWSPQTGCLP